MAQITAYNKIINGTRGDATKLNFNFTTIEDKYNAHDTATTGVHDVGNETIAGQAGLQTLIDILRPVGTVVSFWRPSGVSFDAIDDDVFLLLNGQTVDDTDSLFDEVILTDNDNKYLISVASGGEINATAIGRASHLLDLSHTHTATQHKHSTLLHTHFISSHFHSIDEDASFVYYYATEAGVSPQYCYFNCELTSFTFTNQRGYGNTTAVSTIEGPVDLPKIVGITGSSINTSNPTNPTQGYSDNNETNSKLLATYQIKTLEVQRYIRYK